MNIDNISEKEQSPNNNNKDEIEPTDKPIPNKRIISNQIKERDTVENLSNENNDNPNEDERKGKEEGELKSKEEPEINIKKEEPMKNITTILEDENNSKINEYNNKK